MAANEEFLDDFSDDSETNGEVQEEPVICEVEEKQPIPEYSDEELTELLSVLKKIIYLDGLEDSDWNSECDEIIKTWFLDTNHLMLTIFYGPTKRLTASLTFPTEPVFDLMYFLREPNHIFSLDDFHDCVTFGRIDSNVDGTLLLLMEKIYAPIFLNKTDWTESNRRQFLTTLHSFLANMTALHYKLSGLTVLYVPSEGVTDDEEVIKRFELIAEYWITQIRICLSDREQIVPYEHVCPSDEYDFWVYRCEALLGLQYQVKHKDFLRTFSVLEKAQSIFVKPLTELFHSIDDEIYKAQDNIHYLELLLGPCNEISSAPSPAEIPVKLAKIINIIRYIWLNSRHYNALDAITKLYRYVGNQIIRFCQQKIQVGDIFAGNPSNQIKLANLSVDCCLYYKVIYGKMSQHEHDWNLDESLIFNHVDSFVQRLHDFIEICGAIQTFHRRATDDELKFGGDRGTEFEGTCKNIEEKFENGLKKLQNVSDTILNIGDENWKHCMSEFREMISILEEIINNMLLNVFAGIENVEEGIYALACFHRFVNRMELRKKFERKVIVAWSMFGDELSTTNDQLVEEYNEYLSIIPEIAGRANQLKLNRHRIIRLRSLFECDDHWLPESIDTEMILSNYNAMIVKMQKSIQKLFDDWIQSLGVEVISKLNRLILKRCLTQTGLFECNLDQTIFIIFNEAHFFKRLGFGFPVHINQFFIKEPFIRSIYDAVIDMITSYNRILQALTEFERSLLRPLILICDKCIAQGALKLIWANEGLDIYISDCNKNIRDLNDVVSMYRQTNAEIVAGCERMCQIIIVEIPKDEPQRLDVVEMAIERYCMAQMALFLKEYDAVCDLITNFNEELSFYMETIHDRWMEYVMKFDKLIEEAIKIVARKSLKSVHTTLHGNGVLKPDALFHLVIDIRDTEMIQEPEAQRIRTSIESIFDRLLKSISTIPRLVESLNLHSSEKPINYSKLIESDPECLTWRTKINAEIKLNEENMQCYRKTWLQYAHLWQSNKMVDCTTAMEFDKKIQEHLVLSNEITIRELSSKVHFMLVNAIGIRRKIRNEIDEWKQLYLKLLKQKTNEKLMEFLSYIDVNTERISHTPKSVDELQCSCTIYEQLTNEIERCKCILNELSDQFNVLNKYGVQIDDELNALHTTINARWEEYLNKLNDADEMLNNAKDSFKLTLESKRKTPDFF